MGCVPDPALAVPVILMEQRMADLACGSRDKRGRWTLRDPLMNTDPET